MSDGSNAPKERINISYKAKTNGVSADVELPLKLMVMSNFTGDTNKIPLEEREPVSINKVNFNKVMEQMGITADFTVKNTISPNADEMNINLNIKSMGDFSPDSIVKQVPELKKLMALREALTALKGPMGNVPEFRKKLLSILNDAEKKEQLMLEIAKSKENNQE